MNKPKTRNLRSLMREDSADFDPVPARQPAPDAACSQSRESAMVVLEQGPDGTPAAWCDPEIADLVSALNKAGIRTVASCSGHGHRPGNIMLSDGRELAIARDFDEARKIDAIFPGINGEPPMVGVAGLVQQHHRDSAELRRLCQARDEQRDGRLAALERAAKAEADVAQLVEALERIASLPMNSCSTENDYRLSAAKAIAAGVLAAHRSQGGVQQ